MTEKQKILAKLRKLNAKIAKIDLKKAPLWERLKQIRLDEASKEVK